MVYFIVCPAHECTYELWHTFDFVVLLYKQKPMSDMIIGSGSILHISQRVGSHFNRGAETAEKESCASVQGLLRASHNLVNNQICKRFWFVGHPNVCLVSYFGLPCSNKASFDRNLKKNKCTQWKMERWWEVNKTQPRAPLPPQFEAYLPSNIVFPAPEGSQNKKSKYTRQWLVTNALKSRIHFVSYYQELKSNNWICILNEDQ